MRTLLIAALTCAPLSALAKTPIIALFTDHDARDACVHAVPFPVQRSFELVPGFAAEVDGAELALLEADPNLVLVEEDPVVWASQVAPPPPPPAGDEVVPLGVSLIRAVQAHGALDGFGVRVAVLDSGIDLLHPDRPSLAALQSFVDGSGVQDVDGHGTHVAGTLAAPVNGVGVVGVAPRAQVMVGKVLGDDGRGLTSDVVAGIEWATLNGADVINLSLGSAAYSQAEEVAIEAAAQAGVVIVAASGNRGRDALDYPARFEAVIAVGSVDGDLARAPSSSYGPDLDLVARGVAVYSDYPRGQGREIIAEWGGASREVLPLRYSGTGEIAAPIHDCGLATDADPHNRCPNRVAGAIAHVRRGQNLFFEKVDHAMATGALAVIVSNNVDGPFEDWTLFDPYPIPVVQISRAEGDALQAQSGIDGVVAVLARDYQVLSGTSMAAPHVAGAAALLIQAAAGERDAEDVRAALEQSAVDLGDPGWDPQFGHGLIDVIEAVLALGLPGCPLGNDDGDDRCNESDPCPRDPQDDLDGDGFCADVDTCPQLPNPDQTDLDQDGQGDACDLDDDGDDIPDRFDTCPRDPDTGLDSDRDGIDNACDEGFDLGPLAEKMQLDVRALIDGLERGAPDLPDLGGILVNPRRLVETIPQTAAAWDAGQISAGAVRGALQGARGQIGAFRGALGTLHRRRYTVSQKLIFSLQAGATQVDATLGEMMLGLP